MTSVFTVHDTDGYLSLITYRRDRFGEVVIKAFRDGSIITVETGLPNDLEYRSEQLSRRAY